MPERSLRAATRRFDFAIGTDSASLEHRTRGLVPVPPKLEPSDHDGVVAAWYAVKDGQVVTYGPQDTYKEGNSPVDNLTGSAERTP